MNSQTLSNRPINLKFVLRKILKKHLIHSSFQAAFDLWNMVRYISQLPADYLINRISVPSQQAIVLSARNYLEYS